MAHMDLGPGTLGDILLLRRATLGSLQYHVLVDSGIVVDGTDPNETGATNPPNPLLPSGMWPRGDGTPRAE